MTSLLGLLLAAGVTVHVGTVPPDDPDDHYEWEVLLDDGTLLSISTPNTELEVTLPTPPEAPGEAAPTFLVRSRRCDDVAQTCSGFSAWKTFRWKHSYDSNLDGVVGLPDFASLSTALGPAPRPEAEYFYCQQ